MGMNYTGGRGAFSTGETLGFLSAMFIVPLAIGLVIMGVNNKEIEKRRIPGTDYVVVDATEDVYIVVDKNGKRELHYGDIEKLQCGKEGEILKDTDVTRKLYSCGEVVISNQKVEVFAEKPDESYYNHECEDCFGN